MAVVELSKVGRFFTVWIVAGCSESPIDFTDADSPARPGFAASQV
ncbi:hypothetical protein ABT300_07340 [Streptomyces sp. NPDC001027]